MNWEDGGVLAGVWEGSGFGAGRVAFVPRNVPTAVIL